MAASRARRSAGPLYRQAKAHLIAQITAGKWRPGERILTELELAKLFKISRMTANRAMAELAAEGYIERIAGAGSFVAERRPHGHLLEIRNIAEEIAERGHRHNARVIVHETLRAPAALAQQFGLPAGAKLYHSLVVHLENARPIQAEDRYVNPALAPGYLKVNLAKDTANRYLSELAPLAEAEHIVSAIRAPRHIARLLNMQPGEPCLLLHRRTWSDGAVASVVDLHHPGSRYDLVGRIRPGRGRAGARTRAPSGNPRRHGG